MTKAKIKKLEKEITKLKDDLKHMTQDRDASIWMYNSFLETSIVRGKSVNVLMKMANKEMLTEALAELYDFRAEKTYTTEEMVAKVKHTAAKNKQHEKENELIDLD